MNEPQTGHGIQPVQERYRCVWLNDDCWRIDAPSGRQLGVLVLTGTAPDKAVEALIDHIRRTVQEEAQ